jgi:type IV pilus assembly protein PilM
MSFDQNLEEHDGPVIFLDIGTNATDVIVVEEGRCWIRTFPLGGTHFTEAIASAFKLSYGKAEKLKYEAATSKYAKQLMQAMRPVFSDLLQDLQRSIGYYQTAHSDKELATMVGLGSTFKIPGLRKFLGQQLQLNVVRLDEYRKIQVTGREAASFAENAVNMATAYGLALQGVGLGGIDANLVPTGVLREAMWHQKTKWFAAAAAIVVLGSGMMLLRPFTDKAAMEPTAPPIVDTTIANGNRLRTEFEQIKSSANVGFKATNMMRLLENRTIWPQLVTDVSVALASTGPQDALLGDNVAEIMSIKPEDRRFIELEQLSGAYVPPAGAGGTRSIDVTMYLELSHERPDEFLNDTVADWLRSNAEREGVPYRITNVSINPSMMSTITVDDDGIETTRGGDGSSGSRPRSGGSSSGDDRTGGNNDGPPQRRKPGGARKPPGPGGGGGGGMGAGGGGGTGMGSGSDIPSRRKPGQNTRKPPGPGGGGGGGMGTQGSGGSGMSSGGGGGQPQAPRPGADPKQLADIDGLAPIGSLPNRYPAGSKYYKVPVTFTVEIIDQDKPAAGDQTARANGAEEQRS